jgi:hypothetical protein
MRLNFRAAREEGMFDGASGAAFCDWYVRFIAHFIRVYERSAPPFARTALAWSSSEERLRAYDAAVEAGGDGMPEVYGQSPRQARAWLENQMTDGLCVGRMAVGWPYDQP